MNATFHADGGHCREVKMNWRISRHAGEASSLVPLKSQTMSAAFMAMRVPTYAALL